MIFALLLYPQAQKKAQDEIDRVVGSGRLPDFSDRESLPFVNCLMYETIRQVALSDWQPDLTVR